MMKTQILIVEDEGIVAEDLRFRLEQLNYSVPAVASSGESAIRQADNLCPDLVLMDIRLKGKMDGIQAAEIIKQHLHIPVIFLTAYADDDTLQRARMTTPYGYILKPFDERELHIAIEISLYKHRTEIEREQLISELQDAMAHVKHLRGLLPICSNCKKIRDDHGYWQNVEQYIIEHSEADFSHGICPDCLKTLYPEFHKPEGTP